MQPVKIRGFLIFKNFLDQADQRKMVRDIHKIVTHAPLLAQTTPQGKPMSVRTSAAGKFGWRSDRHGYRYETQHPNGADWPFIPNSVIRVWENISGVERQPECCLVNYYGENTKMGLHRDEDEADFSFPIVSISLGDSALFRMGGPERKSGTESIWLESGDVCLMAGPARVAYHGIDRIRYGSSKLLKSGGRLNLTLRVVE